VSDEQDNVTFVFDTAVVEQAGFDISDLSYLSKEEKKELIAGYPGAGITIKQTLNFASKIEDSLFNEIKARNGTDYGKEYKPIKIEFVQDDG
jgi:hypothetical protein